MARPSPGPATSLEILSSSAILRAAPWADVERLAQRSTVRRYRRGSVILARGTVWDSLLVVGRGLGKATAISPGDEAGLVLSILRPGDIFGENSLFNRMPVPLSLIAISESDVALVPHADVITLMERRPAIAIAIASSLCEKMRFAVQMTVALRFLDASSRLHQRLQLLSGFDSWRVGAAIRIQHGLTQQELADSIGTSREALNKIMSEWRREGLIEYGRGYTTILDPSALNRQLPASIRQQSGMAAPLADHECFGWMERPHTQCRCADGDRDGGGESSCTNKARHPVEEITDARPAGAASIAEPPLTKTGPRRSGGVRPAFA